MSSSSTSKKQARAAAARRAATRRRLGRIAIGVVGAGATVVVVALLARSGSGSSGSSGSSSTATSVQPASFVLPELNGHGRVALAQLRGKPTVVNFFASWCSACREELPGFQEQAAALRGQVNFVGVNSLETGDKNILPEQFHLAPAFVALAADVGGAQRSGLHDALGGGNSMPLTAFYDAGGQLLDVQHAALPPAALKAKLAELYHLGV